MKKIIILIILSTLMLPVMGWAATLELYMADPEVRIAQKIYCQIADVAVTDKIQAYLDGTVVYQKDGNLQSEEIFTADYKNLTAGNHTLTVRILDSADQELTSVIKNWTTLHNGSPTVGIDENNAVRVNGELIFPVYAPLNPPQLTPWVQGNASNAGSNMQYLPDHTVNSDYTLEEYEDYLDIVAGLGIRNIGPVHRWAGQYDSPHGEGNNLTIMQEYVESLRDHPGVLMWQWADEPDGGNEQVKPTEIRSWTELNHQYDTNHPHSVNLIAYNWSPQVSWAEQHNRRYSYLYGAEEWPEQYPNGKQLLGDIIGFDYYPVELATKPTGGLVMSNVTFENMADALDRIRDYNYNLVPIYSWNENCDIRPDTDGDQWLDRGQGSGEPYAWTPAPTPEEMWAEYWIKVIHGVKGFKIHASPGPIAVGFHPATNGEPPINYETMQKFLNWMDELKYAVLGPDYEGSVTDVELQGGRVDIITKKYDSKLYILAGNVRKDTQQVQFTLDQIPENTSVEVYGENRSITINNENMFEDSFGPLSIHIYVVALPTTMHYVRSDATGNNDGSDWENAFLDLPDELLRGHTYYISDGTYGTHTFDDPEDGEKWIYIKKAIETDHGTGTGWQSAYGDGQAVFTIPDADAYNSRWRFQSQYYDIDGQVGGGPGSWKTGHGFQLRGPGNGDYTGGCHLIWIADSDASPATSHQRFSHIEFRSDDLYRGGTWPDYEDTESSYGISSNIQGSHGDVDNPLNNIGPSDVIVSHCYFHDIHIPINLQYSDNWTFEYNCWSQNTDDDAAHDNGVTFQSEAFQIWGCDNFTIRYNYFENIYGTAVFAFKANQAADYLDSDILNWKFYGNVFYNDPISDSETRTLGLQHAIIDYSGTSGYDDQECSGMLIYNNTFIHMEHAFSAGNALAAIDFYDADITTGNEILNNIFYQFQTRETDWTEFFTKVSTHDYNWYYMCRYFDPGSYIDRSSDLAGDETNGQLGTSNPFTDFTNGEFTLSGPTVPGTPLGPPYNTDMFGNTRGADGVWDRGAIEYGTGIIIPRPEPDPEPQPEPQPDPGTDRELDENADGDIPDKTLLSISNNIIKSGGNISVNINCYVKEATVLTVKIYDSKSKEIITLWNKHEEPGTVPITWYGQDSGGSKVGSGIYMIYMECGGYKETKKIAVIR